MRQARNCLSVVAASYAVVLSLSLRLSAQGHAYFPNPLREGMGTNLNWIGDGDGLHLSDPGQPASPDDSLIRSLGYKMLRIPGGYLARTFDWQQAVGDNRGMARNIFSGRLEPLTTGLP